MVVANAPHKHAELIKKWAADMKDLNNKINLKIKVLFNF
jgi:hypothetical protein